MPVDSFGGSRADPVTCAALIAFFGFNVFGKENKIFMGDTGSLILGLIMSVLVIKFNEANITYNGLYKISSAPAVSFGILIVPLFDTLRAGMPAIVIPGSLNEVLTTEFAPIAIPSAMVIGPYILTPGPI